MSTQEIDFAHCHQSEMQHCSAIMWLKHYSLIEQLYIFACLSAMNKACVLLLVATHHLYAQRYCPIHVPVATHCLSVSLCVVQFTFPVVTHYLRVCLCLCELASSCFPVATHCLRVPLCPCRCFGVWTRSWHRGSISPLSTGSSLTPSTPRSASHALDHPYPCLNATLFVDKSLLLLQKPTASAVTCCSVLLPPNTASTPKQSRAIFLSAE